MTVDFGVGTRCHLNHSERLDHPKASYKERPGFVVGNVGHGEAIIATEQGLHVSVRQSECIVLISHGGIDRRLRMGEERLVDGSTHIFVVEKLGGRLSLVVKMDDAVSKTPGLGVEIVEGDGELVMATQREQGQGAGIEAVTSWFLVGFVNHCAATGTPAV